MTLARYERGWTGSMLDVWAEDAQSEIDRLRAKVEKLKSYIDSITAHYPSSGDYNNKEPTPE